MVKDTPWTGGFNRHNETRRWGGGYKNFHGDKSIIEMKEEKSTKKDRFNKPLMNTKSSRSIPRERLISNYSGREYSNQMPWEWND